MILSSLLDILTYLLNNLNEYNYLAYLFLSLILIGKLFHCKLFQYILYFQPLFSQIYFLFFPLYLTRINHAQDELIFLLKLLLYFLLFLVSQVMVLYWLLELLNRDEHSSLKEGVKNYHLAQYHIKHIKLKLLAVLLQPISKHLPNEEFLSLLHLKSRG